MRRQIFTVSVVVLWWFLEGCLEPDMKNKVENPECPNVVESKGIVSCWNWLETRGVESGIRITPESAGYKQTYRFDPDSLFYLYRDGRLSFQSRYHLNHEPGSPFFPDTVLVLKIERWDLDGRSKKSAVFFNGSDTLTLYDLAFDAATNKFVRIR